MNKTFVKRVLKDFIDLGEMEIKTGPFGTQLHASDYVEQGTPVINVRNIGYGRIKNEKLEYINEETVQRLSSHLLKHNDIVFGRKGAVDRHALIGFDQQEWFQGSDCLRIRIKSEYLDPLFLSYYFLTENHKKWMMAQCSHGATMASLNQDIISRISICLPSIDIQHKVATILSAYDGLIEYNQRRIKVLEEMAQIIYNEWFVKFKFPGHENMKMVESELGMIPEGWEVKQLNKLVLFQNNGTSAGEHLRTRIYLPIDCISRKSLSIREVSSWKEAQSSLHLFDEGDILFGAMRPYFHKVAIAPFKGVTRKTCFVFKSISPEYHAFAALTLFRDETVSFANAHSKGATIPYAVWPQAMDSMPVVVPPTEQAKKFEQIVGPMLSRIGTTFFQNNTLRITRDLLLPRLISGEIDVSELDIDIGGITA